MAGYPVTPGYTINIVKDRKQPAVLLLNSAATTRGAKTFFITVPEHGQDDGGNITEKIVKRKAVEDDIFYFVEDSTEEVISSEVIVEEDGSFVSEVETDNFEARLECSDPPKSCDANDSNSVLYFEENNSPYNDPSVFFTEVAHEEVVIEEVLIDNIVEERKPSCKSVTVISNVQCDLCNSNLKSAEEAKTHMRHVHNIVTYDGTKHY